MVKIFTTIFLITLPLLARENPFLPVSNEEDIPFTTNKKIAQIPLKRASITLPSTARIVESITIKYKNLDGSITKKTEELGNSVDWHLPIFISQNINEESEKSVISKSIKKKYQKLLSSSFVQISSEDKKIKITTKDRVLRNFMLTNPHRIVCDIKRDIDISTLEKSIPKKSIVKNIRIGNHNGYYRIVIELDGYYTYHLLKRKPNYIFVLG